MYYPKRKIVALAIFILIFTLTFTVYRQGGFVYADKAEELRQKIQERNDQLKELQREIADYQAQVETISKQASTLKSTVDGLELVRKKLLKDIQATQNKIQTTNLIIEELELDIGDKESRIVRDKETIAQAFRRLNIEESKSLIETLIEFGDLGEFWNELANLTDLHISVREKVDDLQDSKKKLEASKTQTEAQKTQLVDFTKELRGQTKAVETTKQEKADLLARTKNEEANYKKLLDDKLVARKAFEEDLANLESELRLTVDPSSLPRTGSGVLHWPLDSVVITQYFGNTRFATQNPQAYSGQGHNGIDLRAAIGTPVRAALSGTIVETGNTDLVSTCFSYGKWILVRHDTGLSTVYAHLSSQIVSAGQRVATGEVLGYSGYSGNVLPPGPKGAHLHFTVYATQGVQVRPLVNSINCRNVRIPAAEQKAYLNPLSYL